MAPLGNWNVEFLDLNGERAYPLAQDATGLDTSGTFRLPTDFLVELDLPVTAGNSVFPDRFFLLNVGVYSAGVALIIGYASGTGDVPAASVYITKSTHTENKTYKLTGVGDFADSQGVVTIGTFDSISQQPNGFFVFDIAGGKLEASTIRPQLRGLRGIVVVNGTDTSDILDGIVSFIAGSNMFLVPVQPGLNQPVEIQFNAADGAGFTQTCECLGDTSAQPILTINGVTPTPEGDFTLLPADCVTLTNITNGLRLSDSCSTPCCGCAELEAITQQLERFGDQALTLQNFLNRLETVTNQMSLVVLGSRLNDATCTSC